MTDEEEVQQQWTADLSGANDASDADDEQRAKRELDAQTAWDVQSIRDEWTANQVRLPEHLQRQFNAHYGRLESDLTLAEIDRAFGKDRHYKPLVIALGLQRLARIEPDELSALLSDLEREELLEP